MKMISRTTHRLCAALLCACMTLGLATHASAQPQPTAAPRFSPAWQGETMAWQALGGTVGMGAGGLAGLLVSAGVLKLRGSSDGFADLGLAFLGAGAGAVIGTSVGTWLVGDWQGGTGGLGWSAVGTLAGVVSGVAIGSQVSDEPTGVFVGAAVLGVAGSILGYHLSSSTTAPPPMSGALRIDARGRVHAGAPLPLPVIGGDGVTRGWQVSVLSGRF